MSTPKDNTEVVRMLREVKNSIWKSVTPMKVNRPFNEYISNLSSSSSSINKSLPSVATRLQFSSMDESQIFPDTSKFSTFKTPEGLERKLRNAEVELQASKAKLTERESYISVMEPANKKLCLSLETKLDQYRKQSELNAKKIEELEGKLRWAKKQTECAKSQVLEVERKKKIELDKMEFKIIALQQECSNLKVEMVDLKSEKTETVRKLRAELGRLELKVDMLTTEAEKSKEYIESLKRKNTAMAEKIALCDTYQQELKEAENKIKALENKIEADKDAALIVSSRQSDLKLLVDLQKENQLLKEELSNYKENNVPLIQEKLWSLEEKLVQAEKKSIALTKVQVENEQLKERIRQWEELFDDKSTTYKSPTAFSRKLSDYQKNEIALSNKLSQVTSRCDTLEKQKCELEESIKSLNHRLQQYQAKVITQDTLIKRFQRKVIFLTKERDNCRKLLDSYLSETTMTGVALNEAQLSHLEDMNMEYKRALEKSEKEVDSLNEKLKNLTENSSSMDMLASEMKKLRDENSLHLARIVELEKEKLQLENKYANQNMGQEKSSWDGRILHLKCNPLDNANAKHLEAFKKLQEENDHLKKRIKVLEEEGVAAADVTMKVQQKLANEGADSTLKSLKEQLAAAERQQRFILENARIKSTEFREAVYRLLGYRIDVPAAETYKFSHVYAESRDDYLLFQINSEGIQLIETEYSKQLGDRMELYLQQYDSFPAFLASLTMDLFSQQTYMMN